MNNIALITARGGSKGLPRKNILDLHSLPLIAWTIRAALNSKFIDQVYVTTEDAEIIDISQQYGAEIILRPRHLASDNTASEPVIAHALEHLKKQSILVKDIFLLQPTSPLRTTTHIDEAYDLYINKKADSVISLFEPSHHPLKAFKVQNNGTVKGLISDDSPYCRRQDLPVALQPNGAIYIFNNYKFLRYSKIPRTNIYPYIMSETESLDVDTIEDLNNIESYMKSKNYEQPKF